MAFQDLKIKKGGRKRGRPAEQGGKGSLRLQQIKFIKGKNQPVKNVGRKLRMQINFSGNKLGEKTLFLFN